MVTGSSVLLPRTPGRTNLGLNLGYDHHRPSTVAPGWLLSISRRGLPDAQSVNVSSSQSRQEGMQTHGQGACSPGAGGWEPQFAFSGGCSGGNFLLDAQAAALHKTLYASVENIYSPNLT